MSEQLTIGQALRDAGAASVDRDDWWRSCADQAIDTLIAQGRPFTSDDLRALGVPEPVHANAWGARMLAAAKAGRIVRVGYVQSGRADARGRALTQWQGAA